ncbi:hypothetical protein AVEN_179176-1 [Araneus ventricosus]|uniref:Endonuclease/exonuclease/phosphatase domain-containing protein n=1 Tax=Araneus ventricosus TaxID=182803 RepID=A0A4Y2C7K9_ARAVE|nr:hypothetical protein AVEN_179176-1 [Araneus ventricosus]
MANEHLTDIIIVQEPYVKKNRIEGLPSFWKSWLSKNQKPGIIALPSCNNPIFIFSGNNMVAIKIQVNSDPLSTILSYSSPYSEIEHNLNETNNFIASLHGEDFLIGADLNAHRQSWGYNDDDTRGGKVANFILSIKFQLINTPGAPPTFVQLNSKGLPDLIIVSIPDLANNSEW